MVIYCPCCSTETRGIGIQLDSLPWLGLWDLQGTTSLQRQLGMALVPALIPKEDLHHQVRNESLSSALFPGICHPQGLTPREGLWGSLRVLT